MLKKHVYLEGGSAVYTCTVCRAHLATRDHVVSEVRREIVDWENFGSRVTRHLCQ